MIPTLVAAAIGACWAAELPLPTAHPKMRPWLGGDLDLSAGVGIWQAPSQGHNYPRGFPRTNVHLTAVGHLGPALVVGVHWAVWSIPYGPGGDYRTQGVRVEPRIGWRIAQNERFRLDLTAGLALDAWRRLIPGPVIASTARIWPGRTPGAGLFFEAEARLALRYSAGTNYIGCIEWCDSSWTNNPGGTGLIVGVGWSVP